MAPGSSDRLRSAFTANFEQRGELGASLVIFRHDRKIVDLHHGFADRARSRPWTEDTLVPFWSATKGLAAATVLLAMARAGLTPDSPIAEVWPALDAPHRPTLGHLLSHRGQLAALDDAASLADYETVIASIESQARSQLARPSIGVTATQHGYHPRTFGFIADELVRRLTGGTHLSALFRQAIAEPLSLDLWIGLPPAEDHRVAELLPGRPRADASPDPFYAAFADKASLTRRAFHSPHGLNAVSDMNRPESRRLRLPAMGGIGSARGLANFYAVLANGGTWRGEVVFPAEVCRWAETPLANGPDAVLLEPTSFSAGFQLDPLDARGRKLRRLMGPSTRAFGHPGAGGSHAFADPEHGIGFAYLMNQMELSVLPTLKAQSLVDALYA